MRGNRVYLRALTAADVELILQLQQENRDFFEKYSMIREQDFYTYEGQLNYIKTLEERREKDQEYCYGIFIKDNMLIGTINLFQVLRGSLQSAFIGYFLDEKHNGQGYMTEAVKLLVDNAFENLKLHRIEAGVMQHNIGSIRVLEKSGFHKEGLARKNVRINGKWEDHQVLAIINPKD